MATLTIPAGTSGSQASQSHPAGCYYVNLASGTIQRQCNPVLAVGLAAAGFVGVDGNPANPGNAFPTFADAQQFAKSSTASGVGHGIASALTGWENAVGNFFTILTSRQTLVRIAEGLIGINLIAIGIYVLIKNETFSYRGLIK
jgi:hypothetical protein